MSSLSIGDPAPDFALPDQDGAEVRLSALRGAPVLLFFYPKDDTGGCTKQACGFRDEMPAFDAAGARVFGISPDGQASHRKFRDKNDLPYPLLVDEDHAVADAYGAWGVKKMYGREYEGIIRSHVLIDAEGRIADIQIKVSPKKSVELATKAVAELA